MKWLLVTLSLVFSSQVAAENTKPWWQLGKSVDEAAGVSDRLFSSSEKALLREYLRTQGVEDYFESDYEDDDYDSGKKHKKKKHKNKKKKKLPPGLQKKVARGGQLPPGWQKKVARGEVLDGDMYEVSQDLPKGILDQLENVDGASVRQVEDRVVRVMDATGVILDVLTGN